MQDEVGSDVYPSQYCNPPPSQSDQQQTTEMRPLGQTVSYPSDTTIVARGFYTPIPVVEGSYVSGQRHLISPPYPANPWSNVALPATDADMRRSSHPPTPQLQSHPYLGNHQLMSSSAPKPQPAPDSVSQMYVQDVALPSSRNRNKKRTDMAPDYSSNSSMKSSHYNDRPGRNDADTSQTEAVADVYPSQYCNPPPSHIEQQTIDMRPLGQTVSYPSDTTIVARGFYTPYMNENSTHTETNSSSSSNKHLQSRNISISGSQTSINRPLPPVPH
ncbi:unnamed protein product [Acanthosepion pharaonis]|uniref:Uncharacterized protein n=1 Tax=Acanthosepion pharaonis TaxID=158019 RepID=A0A812B0N7_ACAPH|nr:unnamed protein product [Sepia pharaonis]